MASFLQQLRLLLWKNGLSVIRQPAWSLALLVWPLVIFIILAITRSQFPPKLTDTCYVAPRNLPSAGFFPFLQTLMCNTDSTCTNKSYLTEGQSKSHWYTRHRQRRDAESHSLPTLLHGFPPLAHLQKGGLVHSILKRDASNQELLELWDRMLNSSFQNMPNVTSVMHTFNNTALVDQTMESVWESVNVLKKSICSFSMTAINTSASSQNLFTKGSINFCSSNDTVLEASLLTLNQVLTEMLLSNPTEVLGSIGGTVVVLDMLQQETSVWDFLLGLPDLFLKPKDEEILNVGAGELENLNNTLTFLQRTFPQANISTDVTNPVITKVIGFLNYMSGWKGRDVYFKLSDVMTPSSIVLYSSEVKDLINQIKIPLDQIQVLFSEANFRTFLCNQNINASYCWSWEASQIFEGVNTWKVAEQVLLAWSQTSASADLAFTKEVFGSFLGLVSPSSLDAVLKHSRSQRSSDAQPQSLAEQLIFGLSNSAFDFLQGMPGWEYIQTFMMAGHSSMQVARVAIEVQLPFIDVVLKDAKYVQEAFLSLMQNETFANAWADHAMDSTVQTVAKVLEGHTSCKDLFAPWAWMSTYSSINFQLWGTLVCAGNDTRLEEMLLTSLLPVNKKVQQLVGVVNGTVMYNVTPSILMAEWHSLYTISLQYVTALQKLQTELNEDYFAAWIPGNISIGLSQILLTSVTGIFENMGSPLENSSLWPSIEPYFHMAYWILTYQPNATASPNCTLTPTAFTCQTGFTWETAVPLIHSLISKVSREPASLLRPLQGTVALLQNSYLALLQQVIANGLPGQLLGSEISLKDLLLDLINTVDKEIQLLSNIDFTQQFDTQLLNDIMAALGLGQIENLLSGGSQTTSMHPVIMGILQVLNNGSIQILNKEEGFAVLQAILSQLGAILPPEQQYQLEAGLNKTHDLIRDLEICSALGQDCVADIQNVFDNLGAMLTFGNNITMPTTHLWGNMTLPVALDVLALLLPWNMSLPAEASMEISRKIQYLLEHAYASPIFNISQSLQASNLTISELEQVNSVFHSNWSVSILETLNMAIQIPQCVNTQTAQSPQKPPVTRQAECVLQLIQTASGLLEVIPVANNAQITLKNWLNITAVEYQKLNNMSTSGSGPLALTEEVLITTLSAIRQNLQGLDVENITDITNELNILEDLLKNVFREQYTYHTINSTLMEQGQYAQKVYGEITLWYLNKLGNYTSGSMFAEILHQLKQMTEMQVALINAKADMVTLTMNQIQNLNHVRLPLEGEDLVQVGSTIMTLLQGEMALIKGNLEIQQTYYNSLGSQMNISIPAEIEGQIMTYLTLTREWITNPQVMTALARIFQWEISSVDITTAGKDLELLLQAMAPLLSPEDRAFIAVAEQVSQAVNYTLLLASTDGGLQSENFTEAVISTVRVVLESISNETGALPQDVVNNILGAFKSSLQLILNSNMSYAQAITLTQGTIQMVDAVIHTLLPAEAVVVLVPIKNSILSYLNNISQPAGFDQWNELIMNVLTELQNSLPSNNTAQPIISTIIKVTENLLSSNEGNLTRNWIINQHLTIALDKIFQGNVSSVDLAGAGVNLDQLLQAMAPLLSPEDRAFLDVAEQVSQALTYASHVASTDGGLQSENFTEAVISTVRVVLESISNETGALPRDVINNILGAFNGSLQLILNPNIYYMQANHLTQETVQMLGGAIHGLLPAEVAEVLVPMKNSILAYLQTISQSSGPNKLNEVIVNMMRKLQNSLPSNNTAQPIISVILKVTEYLLNSNEEYTNMWHNLGNFSLGSLNEITEQLAVFLGSMSPFMNESAQTVTESVGVLVQILSGSADQLTFDKLEDMLAALFSTFKGTPMWDSLPSVISTIHQAIVNSSHNMQTQTELLYVLQEPMSNLLSAIFHVMNTSNFTSQSFVGGLPQALVSTAEAALQAGLGGQSLNCSYMQQIWQDVRAGAGSEDTVALWCNISLLPVIAALDKPAPDFNMTEMAMNPLWINATAGMMAESLETFYEVILNSTFASNHLTEVLLQYTSMLSNLSVLEITNQTDWNVQLFQMQLYQSLSSIQMALDQIKREAPLMTPYIEAAGKTIEVILQNFYLLQNSTASPQIIMQALEITLTGMNFTKETINYILSGDIFMNPNGSTVDSLIKEVIQQIIGTGLLGDWPTLYGVMQQILYLEDTSGTLWKTVEFFNWLYNTQETGLSFVLEILRKLYEIVRDALTKMPLPCFSETFIDLFGNVLYMLKQIKLTSDLFDPVEQYLSPLKMEIARGQNLQGLVSNTRNARRIAREVQREPVDDFLDLLDIDYQALLKVLSIPPTSTEIMETIHVFFANPDLGVILKGYLKEMTGGTSQEETIDTALNVLSYLTLPSNGQQFLEMFMDIGSEGWRVQDLDKVEKLAESLGRTIDMAMVLSDQPPLNIPQRIEHMAQQLQASVSNIISQDGNSTNTAIQFLTALNSILTENFEESKDISPQVTGILQNIIGSFSSPGSQMSIESYLAAVDQTAEAFTPLLSGEVAVYFNISGQMMQAFALLEAYPGDIEKVMMSTSKISNSLNRVLALLNITTLQNGQYVQEVTHPLILSSAMATHILFNLSMSNYSLSSNAEREMLLTQTFNQMVVVLPTETHMYLFSIQSALFTALSKVSSTAEITSQFPEISQLVTQSLLNSLNITHDPTSTHMTPDGLVYILMTVSNQVSMSLYKGLMLSGSPVQISQAVNSLSEVGSSIYSIMPVEGQPYINITLNLMETISSVLNDTSTFGDVSGAVSQVVSSVNSLLAMVHHVNTNSSSSIISDLERTLKTILMIIQTDQSPLTQTADITQQLLHTIQNFISLGNSSSLESELPKMVLGASSMNIGHLLRINDTNWTDKLPLLLTNLANSLPEDLQYSPLIKSIMRSLANESQENLHLLQQVLNTTFELGSANSVNESSDKILDHLLTKVCALENMATVQLITSFLPLGPRLLCDTVVPTIQAFHVLTTNLVNQSTDIYDLIFQTFVGDPSTYNTEVDWTSILSEIVGFNVSTLKTLNINITSPAEVKVFELLKNVTLFVEDVERYTSFPPRILQALLDYPLPRNNIQIFAWLANLRQCSDPSSLQLDPTGQEIFSTFCNLTHEWYSITVIFLRHVDTKAALFRLVLSKEIQDLVGIMLELVKFLTDIMHKLVPAINKLQEYLTNIGELNLVANQEFHSLVRGKRSTMSSRATFSTIARALCKNGILTLFAIAKVPIVTETDPSVQTDHKREELIEKFKIPQDASPFCMNLYLDMVNTTGGAVAWAFLKPMLLGQVLYSPDTPVTREIMTKSNSTLHQFGDLKLYASEWIESSSYVMQSADILTKTLPILQNSLRNPFVQNFIQTQTGIDVAQMSSTLSQFSNMTVLLEKNKFIMEQITTLSMLMLNLSSCVNFDRYRAFNSTDELDRQAERLAQNRELYASIIFKLPEETSSSLPPNIDYTIRMNIENVMRTDRARNPFWVKDSFISSTKNQRYNRGFVYLQESIERAIIEMQTGKAMDGPAVQMQAFPYPCFYKDEYLNSLSFAFPMALMTCWVLFVAHFVKKLVHERELRLHEYMKMMGVNPISHFFAWLIESAVFLLVTVIILTIILKAGGILPHSDGFVLFLYLSDYGFSVLAISFLVSSFFDKTNIAGLSGSLIYVICFFPFIVLIHLEDNLSFSLKSALSLFSPTCFSYASQYISRYEKQEEGIQWSNMYISPLAGDTSSFGWLCWLLLIDSVVYFIIGIYIRMVFPGKYGIGLPWYFPVTRSFWKDMFSCCSRTPQKIGRGLLFTNMMQEQNSTNKGKGKSSLAENGEDDFSGLPVGVSLYGLTKTYDNRHAVDNLNLSFYEGHVTSLLGHNGAGKTTTMSLLTGLFAPTSGTIEVYGMDMQTSIDDVRKEMGVCMQYDVLFDHLTTKEHLLLYAQIKAPHLTKQEVNEQVRRILMETDMHSHRHKRVGTLSGGMKRKLSISIAFIGGSRLVVLDEPTTGVDPCSRRSIWDIVLQHKQERTIILSTHHLDEAEVLSDRIAFLERGGLKCCGSPFYLKDKLAKGYNLTLTKKVQTPDSNEKLNIEELRAFIQSYLPDAQQKEGEVGDLVFALPPYTPQNAAAYHSLLTGLDQNLDKLQLGCYGISDTTLEEVFLQLTRDNMEPTESETWSVSESVIANDMFASRDSIPDDLNNTYLGDKASLTGTSNVRGLALTAQRVKAMLLKRVHHSRRDWKGLFSQVLLPVLFVIAAMGLGSIKSDLQHFPKIVLSPALYHIDDQYTFFSNQNPAASGLIDSMMSYPGVDHVCVRDPTDSVCKERPTVGSETWISRGNSSATFTTCKCSNQVQSCPALVYDPPHKRNPSSQIVYNLTGINTEDYLLVTANDFIRNRYGGWDFGKSLPIDLKMDMLDVPENRTLSKVWYNPEGHHTMPAYLNSLNNFILRSSLPPEKRQKYTISISSHPYPGQVQDEDVMVGGLVSILVALCVLTGYSIMTASFVIYEVHEHHTGSKRLQQISGISEPFYWIINFFYDMTLYMIPVVLSVAMIAAFQLPAFTERQNLGAVTLLLVLFGFSTFPWMYLLSAVFKDTEMAFIGYVCINLFISVNTIISTSILYFLGQLNQNDQSIQDVYRTMSNIFLVFPQFSFGNGLMELARVDMQVQILSAFGVDAYKNPFNLDVLGWMFISMFLQGVICFTLRLLLNKTLLRKVRCWKKNVFQSYSPNEDEDVLAERLRVDRGDASADILQVNRLTKVYQSLNKRVQAVKSLSVGIPAGECFGLLGVNGAGKTTTFKMLTGDVSPTDGSAKIRDIDGRMVDIIDCRREGINIGYCPQVDALDDLLTGEEHLYFYARIRGISKREIDRVVNYLLKKLELDYHRHNTSESYSCGTRRKLSTALALIGNPQILLLDEPSSGMDPRSKRHLWKIISEQVMGKCAVVLTSHSMEECEALCTRLAIMVKGQFRCLGSLQHIKNRFGKGFTVKMYLAGASCDVDMISNFMQQNFPSTFLKDHHSNMVEYHVPVAPGGVASIFGLLESNKAVLQIKHFSVSQTTLDEVFINFAMAKTDTDEQEATEGTDIDSLDSYNALDR
ncbi:uncharacterized protein abca12 isoform X19 [Carassius gibelio]|uniref:uncharacterized protein abca12 isoform X18 n=1 Tax=Carassius gibelio TaxID=101364 RepID=UPI0022783D35|nr:uncharacterized protein abca12 isoform X18 [Carassius gibelio]XP_052462844.1 uncharacterized protein abca12 isoform X19 [Carassius gibelio]